MVPCLPSWLLLQLPGEPCSMIGQKAALHRLNALIWVMHDLLTSKPLHVVSMISNVYVQCVFVYHSINAVQQLTSAAGCSQV